MYKVFLVDDEPFILDGLKTIINWKDYGFEISGQAADGLEALRCLENEKPDIVITDITMPGMDGLALIQRLKEKNPSMKYIILSGYNEFEFVKKGIALGIENYLLKPINVKELLLTLANTHEKLEYIRYREINEMRTKNILRDNLLYRWITNRISAMELRERASVLQISLDYTFYLACIVKLSPSDTEEDEKARSTWASCFTIVYDLLCASIGQNESQQCFSNYDGEIILIFGTDNTMESRAALFSRLENIRCEIEAACDLEFYITVGDFQKGLMQLHKSYENAKTMQEYRLVYPSRKVYTFDEESRNQRFDAENTIDYKMISKLLLAKDREGLVQTIESIFGNLQKCTGIKPTSILNTCIELIIHIDKTSEELGHSHVLNSNYWEIFGTLAGVNTLDQLKKFVMEAASRAIDHRIADDQKMSPVIRQVLNAIHKNYTNDLSLKTLGYELNINPVYLGQLFQKETGTLFNEYVNKLRMQKAMQLLLNTNLKAIDVSRKTGFTDPNYFFKQFKKFYGISPTEFRSSRYLEQ